MLQFVLTTLGLLTLSAPPNMVLQPGLEAKLLSALRPVTEEVPPTWELLGIEVPQDRVIAVYGPKEGDMPRCDEAKICLVLHHPAGGADPTDLLFDIEVKGIEVAQASNLVGPVRQRLREVFTTSPWKRLGVDPPPVLAGPTRQPSEAAFRALVEGDADLVARLHKVEHAADSASLHFRTDDGPELVAHLSDRPPHLSNPLETSLSFHIRLRGGVVSPADLPARVVHAIRLNDDGALRLESTSTFETHTRTSLHVTLFLIGFSLLFLLVISLPIALRLSAQTIGANRWVWGILALAIILRLAVPGRLIELGIGVMLTDFAQHLIMPRYGPSVPALHHAVFLLFGVDHEAVIATHRVLGCLMLPISVAAALNLFPELSRRSSWFGPLLAVGLGLSPMLVRAEATESNLQPALLGMWIGFILWQRASGLIRITGTFAGLGFAMLARPELVLIIPFAWALLLKPWRQGRDAWTVTAALTPIVPLQLLHVIQRTAWEVDEASLEFGRQFFGDHLWDHLAETALIEPRIAPIMTTLLAIIGLFSMARHRALNAALLAGGLLWIAVYAVDLSSASAPRLHVAGLAAWTIVAAAMLSQTAEKAPRLALMAGLCWIASAVVTVPWLYAETNEDQEQHLIDRVVESLANEEGEPVIAVLHHTDVQEAVGHSTHRYFPTYKFPAKRIVTLSQMTRYIEAQGPGALYYQGVNCYAALDRDERGGTGLIPACQTVHERMALEPLWVEQIPNRGNPRFQELGYYGPEEKLEVGLWRVRKP